MSTIPLQLFSLFGLFAVTNQILAADLITDAIEDDGTWTLGQATLAYLSAGSGLTPTAGQVMMHFNAGGDAAAYGTSFVSYTNKFAAGVYIVRIDVGSFANRPLATVGPVGLTAGGQLLTPDSSSIPAPAQGEFKTWVLAYTNNLMSHDQTIGFRISVPNTGEQRNIAFDNLRIEFIPKPTVVNITDAIEDDGTWNLGQATLAYLSAGSGLTPTAGQVMMHFNAGGDAAAYGTSFVSYTNKFAAGVYLVRIDVGSFANRPLATVGPVGLTAGGQLLTPDSSSMPAPAQGEFKTWTLAYTNSLMCSESKIGFRISVPNTGEQRNIAFDNLRIEFIPDTNGGTNLLCAAIYHAVEICWESETNKTYQAQWSASLSPPDWHDLGLPQQGTGTNICVFDPTRGQPAKIYRVQVLP